MDVSATAALVPIERQMGLDLRAADHRHGGPLAERRGSGGGNFVFLGYGPRSRADLYNAAGKPVVPMHGQGSLVDLYV
jgi:hypothetical protein